MPGSAPLLGILAIVLLAIALPVVVLSVLPARLLPAPLLGGRGDARAAGPVGLRAATAAERAREAGRDPGRARRGPRFVATPGAIRSLERNLQLAGLTEAWPLRGVLAAKLAGAVVGIAVLVGFVVVGRTPVAIGAGIVFLGIAYLAPDVIVSSRARQRQERIRQELPDTLDQILISIEAGLGLEAAVARAGRHGSGPMAAELTRTVQDMRVGAARSEAYTALAERTTVPELRRFARAIMQADRYGVSIGGVVRTQAAELRAKRRQRAEEKAMKVPVLVLFPLMFCILPVLFIVVLAPALVNLIGSFSGIGR